jgi:hypothetical protein
MSPGLILASMVIAAPLVLSALRPADRRWITSAAELNVYLVAVGLGFAAVVLLWKAGRDGVGFWTLLALASYFVIYMAPQFLRVGVLGEVARTVEERSGAGLYAVAFIVGNAAAAVAIGF